MKFRPQHHIARNRRADEVLVPDVGQPGGDRLEHQIDGPVHRRGALLIQGEPAREQRVTRVKAETAPSSELERAAASPR